MQPHGELILEWKADLLIVHPKGPFNEEGVVDAIDSLKSAVKTYNSGKWFRLEVWEEDTLGSPTVMNDVKKLYFWCAKHGCLATAVVVRNSLQRDIIDKNFLGNIGVFKSKNEAMDWLSEQNDT